MKQTILNAETLELELELVELENVKNEVTIEQDQKCSINVHENQLEFDFN